MIEQVILTCSFTVFFLFMWFNTEAFIEYAKLFGGKKFFYIDDFEDELKQLNCINYIEFLSKRSNSFFIKLITCPLCLGFWFCIAFTHVFTSGLILAPLCYIISIFIYKITSHVAETY
jgi:hypothetical protein